MGKQKQFFLLLKRPEKLTLFGSNMASLHSAPISSTVEASDCDVGMIRRRSRLSRHGSTARHMGGRVEWSSTRNHGNLRGPTPPQCQPLPWSKALIKGLLTTTVPFIRRYLPALCGFWGGGPLRFSWSKPGKPRWQYKLPYNLKPPTS